MDFGQILAGLGGALSQGSGGQDQGMQQLPQAQQQQFTPMNFLEMLQKLQRPNAYDMRPRFDQPMQERMGQQQHPNFLTGGY